MEITFDLLFLKISSKHTKKIVPWAVKYTKIPTCGVDKLVCH